MYIHIEHIAIISDISNILSYFVFYHSHRFSLKSYNKFTITMINKVHANTFFLHVKIWNNVF